MKFVKVQQKNFLENVISDADYKFLKAQLKADGYDTDAIKVEKEQGKEVK